MSSSNSPCAACKCLRRKCTPECIFAPYFPPDNPHKFTSVHKVFGASNVSKLLKEMKASDREDAVNSLAYEAECRLRDPVFGCVGLVSMLQHRLKQVQHHLDSAKRELATYIGPSAMLPVFVPSPYQLMPPYDLSQRDELLGFDEQMASLAIEQQQQQQHCVDQFQLQIEPQELLQSARGKSEEGFPLC